MTRTRTEWITLVALFVAIDAAFLAPALFTEDIRAPVDLQRTSPPFANELGPQPRAQNPFLGDWVLTMHPWGHLVTTEILAGRAPLWDPDSGCGVPLAGNVQSEPFSPYLPLRLLFGDQGWDLKQLAQLLLAQIFMARLVRFGGCGFAGSCVAGLAWSFSGWMQGWAMHPHAGVAAFIPGVALACARLHEIPSLRRAVTAALVAALAIASGHIHTFLAGSVFAACCVGFRARAASGPRGRMAFLCAAVLALLLAALSSAVVWMTFAEYLTESAAWVLRSLRPTATQPLAQLVTLIDPVHRAISSHIADLTQDQNPVDPQGCFVGRIALVLAVIGLITGLRRRARAVTALAVALALSAAVGFGPEGVIAAAWHALHLDALDARRIVIVLQLSLAALAGFGADAVLRAIAVDRSSFLHRAATCVMIGVVAIELTFTWADFIPVGSPAGAHLHSTLLEYVRTNDRESRCAPLGAILHPQQQLTAGIRSLRSYDAICLERQARILWSMGDVTDPGNAQQISALSAAALDMTSTRWLLSAWPAEDTARIVFQREASAADPYDLIAPPRAEQVEFEVVMVPTDDAEDRFPSCELAVAQGDRELVRVALDSSGSVIEVAAAETKASTAPDAALRESLHLAFGQRPSRYVRLTVPPSTNPAMGRLRVRAAAAATQRILVYAVRRGAVGAAHEVAKVGGIRLSERPTALPTAYFAPSPRSVGTLDEAVDAVRSATFDPHRETILERTTKGSIEWQPETWTARPGDTLHMERRGGCVVRIETHLSQPAVVVVTDCWTRGWRATVDGAPTTVVPANVTSRAVAVDGGDHVVVMEYAPLSFTIGLACSGSGLLLMVALALRRPRRRTPAAR